MVDMTLSCPVPQTTFANVMLAHRADITRTRKLVMRLLDECEAGAADQQALQDLGEMMREPDEFDGPLGHIREATLVPLGELSKRAGELPKDRPIVAVCLVLCAVFVPCAFLTGITGQFFKQFGLTISAAVMLSLFVAFTLDPMLSSKLATAIVHGEQRNILVRFFDLV